MSMIGEFGCCSKNTYDSLENAVKAGQFDKAEQLIKEMHAEFENSASKLENNKCSGEVFLALFQYFSTELGVDIRESMELEELGQSWRDTTGDFDMIVFSEKERQRLSAVANTIDYDAVADYINDFFQCDYGNFGETACKVLLENLKEIDADTVLVWHLC